MSNPQDMTSDQHLAMRLRVLALSNHLLVGEDAEEVRAHAESCADCATLLDSLRESATASALGEHLPASLVATWPRSAPRLEGLERELVRRHLERCAECREDLKLLGYAAVIPDAPQSEAARQIEMSTPNPLPLPSRRGRVDTRTLLLGGWGTLATAAALLFAFAVPTHRDRVEPPHSRLESRPDINASSRSAPASVLELPLPIELREPLRSERSKTPEGAPDSSRRFVSVTIPAQVFPRGEVEGVVVEVTGPTGATVLRFEALPAALSRRRSFLLDAGPGGWTAGRYELKLIVQPSQSALAPAVEIRPFPFEVR